MGEPTAVELQLLCAAIAIGVVQLFLAATAARMQQGLRWGAGPRDVDRPIGGVAGRLDRAFRNFMESFPFFAAAVLAAVLAGRLGPLTYWGCVAYVGGRLCYVPLYAAGIPYLRTLVWHVAIGGVIAIAIAVIP